MTGNWIPPSTCFLPAFTTALHSSLHQECLSCLSSFWTAARVIFLIKIGVCHLISLKKNPFQAPVGTVRITDPRQGTGQRCIQRSLERSQRCQELVGCRVCGGRVHLLQLVAASLVTFFAIQFCSLNFSFPSQGAFFSASLRVGGC